MEHEAKYRLQGSDQMILWNEKPYHSLDYELKRRFGEKVYRLSLNGGMTCPNRDGTCGSRGCIFCSAGGSGDFAGSPSLSVSEQIASQKALLSSKRPVNKYIAYFQAYTNTYAPVEYLRRIFTEAIAHPEVVALSVATRPDCLPEDVLTLLEELNRIKPVWVELGLQTAKPSTARFIRRGYALPVFAQAVKELNLRGLETIVHLILGLPGETGEDVLDTIHYLDRLPVQGVKLQLLHLLKGTDLAAWYTEHPFPILTMEEYINLLIRCLEELRPDIVIHRLTGDGPRELLIAPLWSAKKRTVLNQIHRELKQRGTWQGRTYKEVN